MLREDVAGGRHRKFLQLSHAQAGVRRADDRCAIPCLRGEKHAAFVAVLPPFRRTSTFVGTKYLKLV